MKILERLGIDPQKVVKAVEQELPKSEARPNTDMSLTPRAKRAIDLAYSEAQTFGHNYIGTEHLLLGIIREEGGVASKILVKLGVSIKAARNATIALVEEHGGATKAQPKYETEAQQSAKPPLRLAYRAPALAREASFANLLLGIGPLRFTEELLLALCLSDEEVRYALMKQNINADNVRAVMQAVLADPDHSRIQDPWSLSFILDLADKERSNLGDEELGAIHIIIAIATLDSSLAALALSEAGVSLEALRDRKQ